jgi:transcription elongation GreA/GreB family factor
VDVKVVHVDPEIEALVKAGNWDGLEERWVEQIESAPGDALFFASTLRALVHANHEDRAEPLVELLLSAHRERDDAPAELDFVRAALGHWPHAPLLRASLFDALRRVYADRPSLERLLQHFKAAEAREPHTVLQQIETWLRWDVGRAVHMPSHGLGRVTEINLALATLRVEFPAAQKLSLRLAEAEKLLTPLEPGHFLLVKAEDPATLQAQAEADPGALLEHLFRSLQRTLAASEIKELLAGIVPDSRWATWWKKAAADSRLASSGGKRPTYAWSATGAEADAALRAAFAGASGRDRLEMARKHAARSPALAAEMARGVAIAMQAARRVDPSLALEAALTLEKLPGALAVDPGMFLDVEDPATLVAGVEDRALRETAIGLVRARRQDWADVYGRLLRIESDGRTLSTLYDALRDADPERLERGVDDILARPHTAPRAFVWLCRELRRRPELAGKADFALLRKLFDAQSSDAFKGQRAPVRELLDSVVGPHLVAQLDRDQAETFMQLLQRDAGVDDHRKELLRRIVLQKHPALREADTEKLYTTAEALERKRAEFEQITRVDIPRNADEIRKAAAHGDLRENFEYKAARERHEMLSSRAKSLHDDLGRARALDPATIDTARVRVGTAVTLRPQGGGAAKVLTILGPWDSDPGNGVVSYLAPAVQPLLGRAPGDTVQFVDGSFTIDSIRVWCDA